MNFLSRLYGPIARTEQREVYRAEFEAGSKAHSSLYSGVKANTSAFPSLCLLPSLPLRVNVQLSHLTTDMYLRRSDALLIPRTSSLHHPIFWKIEEKAEGRESFRNRGAFTAQNRSHDCMTVVDLS
jgi:hypothetical protein